MTALADKPSVDLGRVPSMTFGVLRRNFLNFLGLAVVLVGIPYLAFLAVLYSGAGATGPSFDPAAYIERFLMLIGVLLIQIIATYLFRAAVVAGAISDLNGHRIDLGAMISGRLGLIPVLVGLAIVQGIAEVFGLVLLLVPGLILITMWVLTVPAVVIEKSGVFGALSRSADLTRGHRWSVFGLIIAYVIGAMVLGAVLRGLLFGVGEMIPIGQAARLRQHSLGSMCFTASLAAVGAMVSATGISVIYYELRRAREGVAPQAIVDTFS